MIDAFLKVGPTNLDDNLKDGLSNLPNGGSLKGPLVVDSIDVNFCDAKIRPNMIWPVGFTWKFISRVWALLPDNAQVSLDIKSR